MPLSNFHAVRVEDPDRFEEKSYRTKILEGSNGIEAVMGKIKGSESMTIQSYRFPIEKYTEKEVKAWIEKNNITGKFEAAKKEDSRICSECECEECECETENMMKLQDLFKEHFSKKDIQKQCIDIFQKNPNSLSNIEFEKFVQGLNEKIKKNPKGMQNNTEEIHPIQPMKKETEKRGNTDHYDIMEDTETFLSTKFKENTDGFLTGRAIVTNIGVFNYRQPDGSIIRELRPPEEVFHPDSLASLEMIPITNTHPKGLVNTSNIKEVIVGMTGNDILKDAYALSIPMKITDPETINDIKLRVKQMISCGYQADLDETPGVWMGVPYDCIQRNIRYNHVAVVDRARAGDLAKIRLDSDSNLNILMLDTRKNNNNKEEEVILMKSIVIDSIDYQAEEGVIKAYNALKKDIDDYRATHSKADTEFSKIEAERDTLKAKLDNLEKIPKLDETMIQTAVKERLSIVDTALKIGVEVNDSISNLDLKKAVIVKVFPEIKLDGKDNIYIDAMFDGALESNKNLINFSNKKKILGTNMDKCSNEMEEGDKRMKDNRSDEEKYKDYLKDAWKNYKPESEKIKGNIKE